VFTDGSRTSPTAVDPDSIRDAILQLRTEWLSIRKEVSEMAPPVTAVAAAASGLRWSTKRGKFCGASGQRPLKTVTAWALRSCGQVPFILH
jgi:hypothetical protein